MTGLPAKIIAVHHLLEDAGLPHAFGGALALAWCTERARGTIDVDVNVFVPAERSADVVAALGPQVVASPDAMRQLSDDGQARLWWDRTPIDVFLDTTAFHHGLRARVRRELFGDAELPFLSCRDLAVFKAFFDRTQDWADLEQMAAAGALDVGAVTGVLVEYLGGADHRVTRLQGLR